MGFLGLVGRCGEPCVGEKMNLVIVSARMGCLIHRLPLVWSTEPGKWCPVSFC